jgi:hypothetical protein
MGSIFIIWGRPPIMPFAVDTWRVIFGCRNRMLSNMTLLNVDYCTTGFRKRQTGLADQIQKLAFAAFA